MNDKKIAVVTGAAGFIGSHMVDLLLDQGYQVRGLDNLSSGQWENLEHRKNDSELSVETIEMQSIQAEHLAFKDADYIFHFAGMGDIVPSIEQPIDYVSANVMGTVHVLEAARQTALKKFVYAASSSCYGLTTEHPTDESCVISPQYPYALSKYLGEQSVLHWGKVYGLPVSSIRIFNAYGPRSRTSGTYGAVFGVFLAQKLANKPYTVVGDGTQSRDFVFVSDVVRAFLAAATSHLSGEIYNLGSQNPQSVNRLVELLGGDVEFIPKRPGEPDCTWADISKIKSQLNWEPLISFEEGVAAMLEHIDFWKDAPVWDSESIEDATKKWFDSFAKVES